MVALHEIHYVPAGGHAITPGYLTTILMGPVQPLRVKLILLKQISGLSSRGV